MDFELSTFFLATIMSIISHSIVPYANVSYVAKLARSSSFMSCTFTEASEPAVLSCEFDR